MCERKINSCVNRPQTKSGLHTLVYCIIPKPSTISVLLTGIIDSWSIKLSTIMKYISICGCYQQGCIFIIIKFLLVYKEKWFAVV